MYRKKNIQEKIYLFSITLIAFFIALAVEGQDVKIDVKPITSNISVLFDSENGNTVILTGDDGTFLVDTKSAAAAEEMIRVIEAGNNKHVKYVVNTHWHFDHVAGNGVFGKKGALIIAHENVRKRMSSDQSIEFLGVDTPASPEEALPLITYEKELNLYINGQDVRLIHFGPGHTDGDTVVYFPQPDVIYVGDLFFNGLYPYIGISSGGSINTMISVGRKITSIIDDNTVVIPGHGQVTDKKSYSIYIGMLEKIGAEVSKGIKSGNSLEKIIASKPTKEFDPIWGGGFLNPDKFTELVYRDLSR